MFAIKYDFCFFYLDFFCLQSEQDELDADHHKQAGEVETFEKRISAVFWFFFLWSFQDMC